MIKANLWLIALRWYSVLIVVNSLRQIHFTTISQEMHLVNNSFRWRGLMLKNLFLLIERKVWIRKEKALSQRQGRSKSFHRRYSNVRLSLNLWLWLGGAHLRLRRWRSIQLRLLINWEILGRRIFLWDLVILWWPCCQEKKCQRIKKNALVGDIAVILGRILLLQDHLNTLKVCLGSVMLGWWLKTSNFKTKFKQLRRFWVKCMASILK